MRSGVVLFLLGIVVPRALCQMGFGLGEMGEMMAGLLPPGMQAFAGPLTMRMLSNSMNQGGGAGSAPGAGATTGATGGSGGSSGGMDLITMAALSGGMPGMAGMGIDQLMPAMMVSDMLGGGSNTGTGTTGTTGAATTSAASLYGPGGPRSAGGMRPPGAGQGPQSSRNLLMTLAVTGHINKVNMMPTPTEAAALAREGVVGIPPNIKMLVCPPPTNCMPIMCAEPEKSFTRASHYVCEGCRVCREGAMGLMHLLRGLNMGAGGPGGPGGPGRQGIPGRGAGTIYDSLISGARGSVQTGIPGSGAGGMPVRFQGMGGVNQAQMAAMMAEMQRRQQMHQLAQNMGAPQIGYPQIDMARQMRQQQMEMASQQMTSQQQQQYPDVTPIGAPGSFRPRISDRGQKSGGGQIKITKTTRTVRVQGGGDIGGPGGPAGPEGSGGPGQGGSRAIVMPGPLSPQLIKTMRKQAQVVSEKLWGSGNQGNMGGNQVNQGGRRGGPRGNNIGGKKRRGPPRRGIQPQ